MTVEFNVVNNRNSRKVVDLLAQHFSSIYVQSNTDYQFTDTQHLFLIFLQFKIYDFPSNIYFNISEVENGLAKLKNIKFIGPNGLFGKFLFAL